MINYRPPLAHLKKKTSGAVSVHTAVGCNVKRLKTEKKIFMQQTPYPTLHHHITDTSPLTLH